jgi:Fur family zinc uptake transcriptional regulator
MSEPVAADSLTRNQALVLAALAKAEGPLSAYDILDEVRSGGIRAPLQVYRALERLVALGLVHRLESLNAFVACCRHEPHAEDSMTAFAICEACGQVAEFSDREIARRLGRWAEDNAFRPRKTTIEIRGCCRACAAA